MRFSKITAFLKKVCYAKSGKKAKASPVDATSIVEVSFQAFGTGSGSDDTIVHPIKLSDGVTYEREDTREHIFFNAAACSSVLPSTSKGCADLPAVVEVNDESAQLLAVRAGKHSALPVEDNKLNYQEMNDGVRVEGVQIGFAQHAASQVEQGRYNTRRTARENEVKFYVESKKAYQTTKKDYKETNNFVFPKRDIAEREERVKRNPSPVAGTCTMELPFGAFASGSGSNDTTIHPTKLSDGATCEPKVKLEHIFLNAAAISTISPRTTKDCAEILAMTEDNEESARRLAIREGKAVARPIEDEKPIADGDKRANGRTDDVLIARAQSPFLGIEKARYNTRMTTREKEVEFYVKSKKDAQGSKKDYQETSNFVFPKRHILAGEQWPKRNCAKDVRKIFTKYRNDRATFDSEQHPTYGTGYRVYPTSTTKLPGPVGQDEAEKIARQFVEDTIGKQTSNKHCVGQQKDQEVVAPKSNKKYFLNKMGSKARRVKTAIIAKMVGITQNKDHQMDGTEHSDNRYVVHVEQVVTVSEEYIPLPSLPASGSTPTTNETSKDHTPSNKSDPTIANSTPATSAGTPECNDEHCDACGAPKVIISWQEEMRRSAARKQAEDEDEYRREARAAARRAFAQRQTPAATYKWVSDDDEPAIVSWQEELRRSAARKQAEEDYEYRREVSAAAKRVFSQRKKSAAAYKWVSDGDEPIYDEPSYEDMGVTMPGIKGRVMVRPRF